MMGGPSAAGQRLYHFSTDSAQRGGSGGGLLGEREANMASALQFGTVVIYADDVAAAVEFYVRVTGLAPSYYDQALGFALLGAERSLAVASHAAGELMLAAGYDRVRGERVRGAEIAFWAEDVAAAFEGAVRAGATPLTPPRVMPWGQSVAYVEAPEGTILGFVTRLADGE
jgi:catechol 2,3-dioxygenase-like lactoylglutathione lyase family enzyme